ncbi:MAG: hypothetical protein MUF83_11665 [Acidimicrobiales bacterium]|jgi:hypothetical protein|nr:hypothetical protein [Acidimicrobiales bacterium]
MPDSGEDRSRWLAEPPAAGEVRFLFEAGEDVELTPEARDALDALVTALQGGEVEGFAARACPALGACSDFWCVSYLGCSPVTRKPCGWLVNCRIA